METRFVHPEWIPGIASAFTAALLMVGWARVHRRARRRRLGRHTRPAVSVGRDAALLVALAAIALALLGPRLGGRTLRVSATGIDVALLFDVSRSMAAADVAPSRLAAAQAAARETLARLEPGDRVALAIFASRGVVLAPLTPDHAALAELVDALDPYLIEPAGSRLDRGVTRALDVFEQGSERARALLVLSDGEDPERSTSLGSGAALRANVRVVTAAFGSDAGANVRVGGVALRDASGTPVVSRRNTRRLARLAEATGGAFFAADREGAIDLAGLQRALREGAVANVDPPEDTPTGAAATGAKPTGAAATGANGMALRRVPAVRVLPLAALAALLLVAEALTRRGPRARAVRGARARLVAAAGLLIAATPQAAEDEIARLEHALRERPGDARLLIELGAARIERGDPAGGERALRAAAVSASDPALAAVASYDIGVAALAVGDLERARDAFFDALALEPSDRQARFNLEWTLAALASEPPPAPPPPPAAPPSLPPPPSPALSTDESDADAGAAPTPLDAATRRHLLLRVEDDLRRSLRAAARADAPRQPRRRPAW